MWSAPPTSLVTFVFDLKVANLQCGGYSGYGLLLWISMWSLCFLRLLSSGSETGGAATSQAHVFTMLSLPTAGKQKLPAQNALQWQGINIKFHRNQSRVSHAKQANRQTRPPLVAFFLRTSWECLLNESKTWKIHITSGGYVGTRLIRLSARLLWPKYWVFMFLSCPTEWLWTYHERDFPLRQYHNCVKGQEYSLDQLPRQILVNFWIPKCSILSSSDLLFLA